MSAPITDRAVLVPRAYAVSEAYWRIHADHRALVADSPGLEEREQLVKRLLFWRWLVAERRRKAAADRRVARPARWRRDAAVVAGWLVRGWGT